MILCFQKQILWLEMIKTSIELNFLMPFDSIFSNVEGKNGK